MGYFYSTNDLILQVRHKNDYQQIDDNHLKEKFNCFNRFNDGFL